MKIDDLLAALQVIVSLEEESEAPLQDAARAVARAFRAKACWIHVLDRGNAALVLRGAWGTLRAPAWIPVSPAQMESLEHGRVTPSSLFSGWEPGAQAVPLRGSQGSVGLLSLLGTRRHALPARDARALQVVARCLGRALDPWALHTARLYTPEEFRQALRRERKRAGRYHRPLSLVSLRLENLEAFCRAVAESDPLLIHRKIGELIRLNLRETDLMTPHQDHGFLVLLPETSRDEAARTAEKLRKLLREYPLFHSPHLALRIRIGLAAFPQDAATSASLLRAVLGA